MPDMKLQDALDQIDRLSDDQVVFARKPWLLDSDAEIGMLDFDLHVPATVTSRGLDYFLEVSVAKEVLDVFGERKPSSEQRRALLMYYAENDAYPQWVYE